MCLVSMPAGCAITRVARRGLGLVAGALLMSIAAAAAADLEILVDRYPDRLELFLSTRADNLVRVFGLPPEGLADASGTVDFASLRNGTWEIGDALLSKVPAALDGAPVAFEAMSLMVHPVNSPLSVDTPFDALLALSVCSAEEPERPLTLAELQGYVGYVAYVADAGGALTLRLPKTGRGDLRIAVREFGAGQASGRYELTVPDGGLVEITDRLQPHSAIAWILFMIGSGLTAGGTLLWSRHARARPSPESAVRLNSLGADRRSCPRGSPPAD